MPDVPSTAISNALFVCRDGRDDELVQYALHSIALGKSWRGLRPFCEDYLSVGEKVVSGCEELRKL